MIDASATITHTDRRRKERKYKPTPAIDAAIRRLYVERVGRTRLPVVREFAKKIGWPKWAVCKRGRELGLARTKESPWSERELEILDHWSWMTPERIQLKLKKSGFARTAAAIGLKLKRCRYKDGGDYYSAASLAECFGCDRHCVNGWIKRGYLKAKPRGTERTESQGGDTWLILHKDVREFVTQYPLEFDLRKVDQLWFIDLLANRQSGR